MRSLFHLAVALLVFVALLTPGLCQEEEQDAWSEEEGGAEGGSGEGGKKKKKEKDGPEELPSTADGVYW
jgi:hypothetical protein